MFFCRHGPIYRVQRYDSVPPFAASSALFGVVFRERIFLASVASFHLRGEHVMACDAFPFFDVMVVDS